MAKVDGRGRGPTGAHHLRSCVVYITEDEAKRVKRILALHGWRDTLAILSGIGKPTIEAAIGQGRMQRPTRERLFAAVEKYEAGQKAAS